MSVNGVDASLAFNDNVAAIRAAAVTAGPDHGSICSGYDIASTLANINTQWVRLSEMAGDWSHRRPDHRCAEPRLAYLGAVLFKVVLDTL